MIVGDAPDPRVLAAARRGDEHAFRELVEPHRGELHAHCYRMLGSLQDAEDALQETLLRAWRGLAGFDGSRPLRPWLYRIAHNACVDRHRKRKPESTEVETASADRPSGLMRRKQTAEAVQRALAELPERQRAALTLVHYEGLAGEEAASVLGVSVEALESLLSRARKALRASLRTLEREQVEEFP